MSDNKKYYYLKLKDNFFDSDAMIILESMPDGYLYSNILLKLYLRSLKFEGKLMFNEFIPYNSTILAQVTRHQVGTVEKALQTLQSLGLIEILDDGAIYMLDIQTFIGNSSTEADRKRQYRLKIEGEKGQMSHSLEDKCPKNTGQMSGQTSDKYPPEKEIEKEKDIELEKELQLEEGEEKNTSSEIQQIVSFCEENGFGVMNSVNLEDLRHNLEKFGFDLLKRALSIAARDHKPLSYANGCLKKWEQANIKTVEDVDKLEQEYQNKKASVASVPAYKNRGKVVPEPSWSKPDYNELMTDEEVEAFKASLKIGREE